MRSQSQVTLLVDLDEFGNNIVKCWSIMEALNNKHKIDSIIFSSSIAIHLPIRAGVHCEYFPCYSSNGFDYDLWNRWLQSRLVELCDAYGIGHIVYVGDRPPSGLLSAIDGQFQARSVWVKGEESGPSVNDLAIHFDRVFEESAAPVKAGAPMRRKGIFLPLPPIFRRSPKKRAGVVSVRSRSGKRDSHRKMLVALSLGPTLSSRQIRKFAHSLAETDRQLVPRIQIADRRHLVFLADTRPETEPLLQTAETISEFSFAILENGDATSPSTILSAGVPAILMRGDPLRRDRNAEFAAREKIALVHDPATALPPRKAQALLQRIEATRKRLKGLKLANGADILCRDLENARGAV